MLGECGRMTIRGRKYLSVDVDAVHPGTTVRYHYRTGDALATVVEKTDRYVEFVGDECNGRFTHDQIDRLMADDRLEIVLAEGQPIAPDGDDAPETDC